MFTRENKFLLQDYLYGQHHYPVFFTQRGKMRISDKFKYLEQEQKCKFDSPDFSYYLECDLNKKNTFEVKDCARVILMISLLMMCTRSGYAGSCMALYGSWCTGLGICAFEMYLIKKLFTPSKNVRIHRLKSLKAVNKATGKTCTLVWGDKVKVRLTDACGRMYEKKYSPHKFPPLFCQEMAQALRMTEQKKSWDPKVLKNCGFDEVPVQPINPLLALNALKVKQREADK